MSDGEKIRSIFMKALERVDPAYLVKDYAGRIQSYYSADRFSNLVITGFGKASFQMAKAAEAVFDPDIISGGIVITKYGHSEETGREDGRLSPAGLKKIRVYEAGHPIPDKNGIMATEEVVRLIRTTDKDTLVLCLVSGGGSALFVCPHEGMTLKEKQLVTDLLLRSGADIKELNAVRKHLSMVKGGRLAELAQPSEIISLMISDVVGDGLDVIASGPTAPDTSTYADALDIIEKYNLLGSIPASVTGILEKGRDGEIPDTPKKDSPVFKNVQNIIIGSNKMALEAAKNEAVSLGYETEIISSDITGDAGEAAKMLAGKVKAAVRAGRRGGNKKCLISGGETTVVVRGKGKGGRNTELALCFAMEMDDIEGVTFLSAGTDGTDGPTDAAGAVVDGGTMQKAAALGLEPGRYLENNDSYNFFKELGSLLITGPTGTNVMDVQIALID